MDIVERLRLLDRSDWTDSLLNEAADEIERLRKALTYEENRFNTIGTHSNDCYTYGPRHYECAMREIERLRKLCEQQHKALEGMSYYSQPRKTDPMELIGFECRQGDKKFDVAAKALAAYEEKLK